jgi:glycosyltransferase involved in cell wall biosynthesis
MHVLQVNAAHAADLHDAHALLARYPTICDWSAALLAVGASRASLVQLFPHDAELDVDGVEARFCRDGATGWPRPWARLPRVAAVAAALRPDVVHLNGLIFPALAWELRRVLPARVALVVQDHASAGPPWGRWRRYAWRRAWHGVDTFLFTAPEQAAAWQAAGCITSRQTVALVPEASRRLAPVPRAEARARASLGGQPACLWVGHLDENKDPLTVLAAFARLLSTYPEATLTLVYRTAPLLPQVRALLAADASLSARVTLRGELSAQDVVLLASAADVFVLGSRREGSGYALIEALACGAVPVLSAIPAFRALTGAGAVGALFPAGDVGACHAAWIRVLASLDARAPERMQAHFARHLSWPVLARQALAAYRAALQRRAMRC